MTVKIATPHVPLRQDTHFENDIVVVVPVYMAEAFLDELVERLHAALQTITSAYQIVLVDDRGPDRSWELIEASCVADKRVVGIRLSRNFGQHPAISAGLAHGRAKWYVVMDCDLQDPPEQIVDLYHAAISRGIDIVIAERETSGLGAGRNLGSRLFNSLLRWASELDVSSRYGNFRICSDKVINAFRAYPEQLRFFPGVMSHLGFASDKLVLPRAERVEGKSSYTFVKLVRLALENIVAYSEKPLWVSIAISLMVCAGSALYGSSVVIRALTTGFEVPGFASLVTLVTFLGGMQLFLMSLVGLYVGRAVAEARARPVFIIDTQLNG
jgi:dolichol-phosphate mannosyltransferase